MQLAITNLSSSKHLVLPYLELDLRPSATITLNCAQSDLSKMVDLQQAVATGLAAYQVTPTSDEVTSGILTASMPLATPSAPGLLDAQGRQYLNTVDTQIAVAPINLLPSGGGAYVTIATIDASQLQYGQRLELGLDLASLDLVTNITTEYKTNQTYRKAGNSVVMAADLPSCVPRSVGGNPTLKTTVSGANILIQGYQEAAAPVGRGNCYSGTAFTKLVESSAARLTFSSDDVSIACGYEAGVGATIVATFLTALADVGPNGFNLAKAGASNIVFSASDVILNNQATFTCPTNTYLELAQAVLPVGQPRTVILWGYSSDNVGSYYAQFGNGLLMILADKVIAANSYVWTDGVALSGSYAGGNVIANQPFCLITSLVVGAPATFSRNGVSKILNNSNNNVVAETGAYFRLGLGTGATGGVLAIGGCYVLNGAVDATKYAWAKAKSTKWGIVLP